MNPLSYMETAVLEKLDRPIDLTDDDKKTAKVNSRKVVAGFDIHDEAEERAQLDRMVAAKNMHIEQFKKDRAEVTDKLAGLGITPLAVIPHQAYINICKGAGLYRLHPDGLGRVGFNSSAFDDLMGDKRAQSRVSSLSHNDLLRRMFPNQDDTGNIRTVQATLVLPTPPADVIAVLMKAQSLGLVTTAVPEAISFKETPWMLMQRVTAAREAEARRIEAMKNDPLVSTVHGTAEAVIAQFGDFPIEKKLIDSMIAAGDLVGKAMVTVGNVAESYSNEFLRQIYNQAQSAANASRFGVMFNKGSWI